MTDVETGCVVVGAGPAGLSAALWLRELGVPYLLLERSDRPGSQAARINLPIRNYPGLSAVNGRDLMVKLSQQLEEGDWPLRCDAEVTRIDPRRRQVETGDQVIRGQTLIIATGLSRRTLDTPGAAAYLGRGVSVSGTHDRERIAGHAVAVIGGGDGALENALILAERSPRVILVHRGETFRARREFVERVSAHPAIEIRSRAVVQRVIGDDNGVQALELRTPQGLDRIVVRWVVVKIGFVPNTQLLEPGSVALDRAGYVIVDRYLQTSATGVFAVGDVANPRSPCIAAAVGDGAVAAREVWAYLERGGEAQGQSGGSGDAA